MILKFSGWAESQRDSSSDGKRRPYAEEQNLGQPTNLARVAQLSERSPPKRKVAGGIPATSTI